MTKNITRRARLAITSGLLPLAALALALNVMAAESGVGAANADSAQQGRADFVIQVGSYNEAGPAQERAARLRAEGLDARVVEARIPGRGVWYRVQTGRFDSQTAASRHGATLLSKGLTREFIVTKAAAVSTPPTPSTPRAASPEKAKPLQRVGSDAKAQSNKAPSNIVVHKPATRARTVQAKSQPTPQLPAPPAPDLPLSEDDFSRISAGGRNDTARQQSVRIMLTGGKTLRADEAWENADGVWYRRGSMVTLIQRSLVKEIQRGQ